MFCGKGLKYLRFCEGYDKEYKCRAVFGAVTDTGDLTGEVISENYPSEEEMAELLSTDFAKVREAFAQIASRTEQKPPSYSAKKIDGVKAYDLARKGEEVDLPPTKIRIYSLVIDKIETLDKGFAVEFTCACSKGTYIRTICTDCGELLGYGAYAQTLRRTKNGPYSVENAYTPDQLFEMAEKEDYSFLQSPSTAISHIPEVILDSRQAKDLGLQTVSYCVGADFLYGSGGNLDAEVDRLKKQVDFAAELGVLNMRHDVAYGIRPTEENKTRLSYDSVVGRLAEGCYKVTEYAAAAGIGTMTENHGFFSQDSERVEKLINTTGHPNFGAHVDIGNFLCADEEPVNAVSRMAPYARHVHCKDFHFKPGTDAVPSGGWFFTRGGNMLRGAILGHGSVKVGQCIRILKNAGYDGFVSIEFEGMEDNLTGIGLGLDFLKKVIF